MVKIVWQDGSKNIFLQIRDDQVLISGIEEKLPPKL